MISISNRPDTIWIEEELTEDGRWVERRRWTKPKSWVFDRHKRRQYIEMMLGNPWIKGIRFVEGKIFWEIHEMRVSDNG